jgi:hypothetical protein
MGLKTRIPAYMVLIPALRKSSNLISQTKNQDLHSGMIRACDFIRIIQHTGNSSCQNLRWPRIGCKHSRFLLSSGEQK